MGQAAYKLHLGDDVAVNSEIRALTDKTQSVRLALINAKAELLDKEASCCNLATD